MLEGYQTGEETVLSATMSNQTKHEGSEIADSGNNGISSYISPLRLYTTKQADTLAAPAETVDELVWLSIRIGEKGFE